MMSLANSYDLRVNISGIGDIERVILSEQLDMGPAYSRKLCIVKTVNESAANQRTTYSPQADVADHAAHGTESDDWLILVSDGINTSVTPINDIRASFASEYKGKAFSLKTRKVPHDAVLNIYDAIKIGAINDDGIGTNDRIEQIDTLLKDADTLKASDIHIECSDRENYIKFRINGDLEPYGHVRNQKELDSLVSVLYSTLAAKDGDMDGIEFDSKKPCDAVCFRQIGEQRLGVRIASHPTENKKMHFHMALRCLGDQNQTATRIPYKQLGFVFNQLDDLSLLLNGKGLFITIGETNSGKSVSQQNFLMDLNERLSYTKQIFSLENPIERHIDGVTQITLTEAGIDASMSLQKKIELLLKFLWRADPDILALAEIRDTLTATAAQQMSGTGHSVLATMHVASPFDVFERFLGLGVTSDTLNNNEMLKGVVAQNLLQKLCPHCSLSAFKMNDWNPEQLAAIDQLQEMGMGRSIKDIRFRNHHGCDHKSCRHGLIGREMIAEVVPFTNSMLSMLVDGNKEGAQAEWLKNGGICKVESAIHKITLGLIDPAEALKELKSLSSAYTLRKKYNIALPRYIYV